MFTSYPPITERTTVLMELDDAGRKARKALAERGLNRYENETLYWREVDRFIGESRIERR